MGSAKPPYGSTLGCERTHGPTRSAEGRSAGKAVTPQAKREAVEAMRERTGISQRRACRLMGLARSVMQYEARRSPDNEQLKQRIVELASQRRRFGYRRIHVLLHREGQHANVKRV